VLNRYCITLLSHFQPSILVKCSPLRNFWAPSAVFVAFAAPKAVWVWHAWCRVERKQIFLVSIESGRQDLVDFLNITPTPSFSLRGPLFQQFVVCFLLLIFLIAVGQLIRNDMPMGRFHLQLNKFWCCMSARGWGK